MSDSLSVEALQTATLSGLTVIRDEIAELFTRHLNDSSVASGTLKALFRYQSERSQTVSFLTSWQRVWDAEIVLRSFYEASAKILLICFSPPHARGQLFEEFWVGFGNVGARRRARKAAFAEEFFQEGDLSRSVFSLLQNDKFHDLAQSVSKARRREIERKWSFAEIIETLSNLSPRGRPLSNIKCFLYIYGTASHLAHADNAALDLMADRSMRERKELAILVASHVSRIWSDQFAISRFCADALAYYIGCESIFKDKIMEADEKITELGEPFKSAFDDSQRDFYAAYR